MTADAMNTQKATAKAIIKEAHGDYCLALKENQRTVYLEVKEYFAYEELLKEILAKEGRYYLCSIKPIAKLFAIVARRHWNRKWPALSA